MLFELMIFFKSPEVNLSRTDFDPSLLKGLRAFFHAVMPP
jgi:hypothetical protein